MARSSVNIITNGLGTAYDVNAYSSYAEWKFIPNDNTRIAYEYDYVCVLTYNNGHEPETWQGTARWYYGRDNARHILLDQYAWGSASYFETATLTITVRGEADNFPHAIVPDGSGRFDYFFAYAQGNHLSNGTKYFWGAHALGDYEISTQVLYYEPKDSVGTLLTTTQGFDYDTTPITAAWDYITRNDYNNWDYSRIRRQEVVFYIPHISVELDLNDSNYTPAEPLSCPYVYIRSKQGDTYGELPTPIRHGYTFIGWYTARSGRRSYGPIQPDWVLSNYSDHTIYAKWSGNDTKTTVSIYDAKNGVWLSADRSSFSMSPKLSAVEYTPHYLSSCTLSTGYYVYFYAYTDNTSYTTLSLMGTGEWYEHDDDLEKYVYGKHETPYQFVDEGSGYIFHITDNIYPANNLDLTVYVWPKRTYTKLPMYLSANGLLLRGVKTVLPIRDA